MQERKKESIQNEEIIFRYNMNDVITVRKKDNKFYKTFSREEN